MEWIFLLFGAVFFVCLIFAALFYVCWKEAEEDLRALADAYHRISTERDEAREAIDCIQRDRDELASMLEAKTRLINEYPGLLCRTLQSAALSHFNPETEPPPGATLQEKMQQALGHVPEEELEDCMPRDDDITWREDWLARLGKGH